MPPLPYQTMHSEGQQAFCKLLISWVRNSGLTFRQFCNIGHWATGESEWISSGSLSRMVNGDVQKISLWKLDLLSATNYAIWLWKTEGMEKAVEELGPFAPWKVKAQWVDGSIWLPKPGEEEYPLDTKDLTELICGRLQFPYPSQGSGLQGSVV